MQDYTSIPTLYLLPSAQRVIPRATHIFINYVFFLVLELVSKYTKINDCLILTSNEVQEVKVCNVVY